MRYKVKMSESLEFVVEGKNENEINDFMREHTIEEVRATNGDLHINYTEEIIEKTVMPADVDINNVPEIYP